MRTPSWRPVRFAWLLGLVVWAARPCATAQTPGRIAITREGTQLTLSWDSVSGRRYQLSSTTDLANPWQEVVTQPKPLLASGSRLSYTLSLAVETRFYRVAELGEFASTGLVWIAPGTFTMGSSTNELDQFFGMEGPQTVVTLTSGFWMNKHEVTQGEYLMVIGVNPSWVNGDRTGQGWLDYGVDLDRPVEQVSWYEATNYCHQLTLRDRAAGLIPSDHAYRLPTEAEWEYACRAGTTNRFSYGDDLEYSELTEYAWYSANSEGMTHAVGQKLPNPWGLYDMHGGVREWCHDFWLDRLPGGVVIDPQGPATGSDRVMCGGNWSFPARHCRSAARFAVPPEGRLGNSGFRVVLAPSQP